METEKVKVKERVENLNSNSIKANFTFAVPYIENRLSELSKFGFTEDEIIMLEKSLLEFTNSIINNFNNLSQECYDSIKKMKTNRKKILSNLSKKESTYKELLQSSELLLEDCKNLGTIPFSMMARISFISSSILKSLIKNNQVSEKSAELRKYYRQTEYLM